MKFIRDKEFLKEFDKYEGTGLPKIIKEILSKYLKELPKKKAKPLEKKPQEIPKTGGMIHGSSLYMLNNCKHNKPKDLCKKCIGGK